jgi:drug/metabolite transporter (DMT)-like permease
MELKNALLLAFTAFIWGTAFVAQSVGMEYIGPFTFNGVRSIIGAFTLLPCILFQKKSCRKIIEEGSSRKDLVVGGLLCGALLFVASSLQQIGIKYTSAGKAGFITSCYIVIVPLIGIFMKKTSGWKIWAAVVLALAGLYCLCITDGFTVGKGDIFIFLCAMAFSAHILVIDYFSPRVNGVVLSCIQFFVCGVASLPCMFVFETPDMVAIISAWMPILYAGVLSCGVAYTLQIIGQRNVNPTIASLILSLESCFSVLAGWVILHEKLSMKESLGCVLMFMAIILAQLPDKKASVD